MSNFVFLGVPTYDGNIHMGAIKALLTAQTKTKFCFNTLQTSLLAHCFNALWCAALNGRKEGITHFLLMHADIAPQDAFIDTMMTVMATHRADVVSAVVPMKSTKGLTSTALEEDGRIRRLTMKEIFERPKSFTEPNLLLNTGLMLVDLRKPWVEKAYFTIQDNVVFRDGQFQTEVLSEDWAFSRLARQLGAQKLVATREVVIDHYGSAAYPNAVVWGSLETDEGFELSLLNQGGQDG